MSVVILTKSYGDPFAIDDIYEHQSVNQIEIPINYMTWIKAYDKKRHCRKCHNELSNWEKAVCIQWHYENKKKTKIRFRCYACASDD